MKKTIQRVKLQLRRESIRELAVGEYGGVVGGIKQTFTPFTGCNTLSQVDATCCGC
jgi:hypothetical protein